MNKYWFCRRKRRLVPTEEFRFINFFSGDELWFLFLPLLGF